MHKVNQNYQTRVLKIEVELGLLTSQLFSAELQFFAMLFCIDYFAIVLTECTQMNFDCKSRLLWYSRFNHGVRQLHLCSFQL